MLSKSHQIFELLLKENLFLKKSPNQVTLVQDPNDDKTSRQSSNSRVRSYGLRQECGRLHGRQSSHGGHPASVVKCYHALGFVETCGLTEDIEIGLSSNTQ